MSGVTISLDILAKAVTEYSNFSFTGYASWKGTDYAVGEGGLYRLGGKEDDNGEEINSRIELPITDFGDSHQKRIRRFYFGGRALGNLSIEAKSDDGSIEEYQAVNVRTTGEVKSLRAAARRGRTKGRYWQVAIENQGGEYFYLSSLTAIVMLLNRKQRI